MARNLFIVVIFVLALSLAAVFAAGNTDVIEVDLAFFKVEILKSVALILAFGFGWAFGVVCAVLMLLRVINDRRKLRKALRLAESEVRSLRNIPLQDQNAD